MPEKMIDTLTLSNLNFVYILIKPKNLYKLYSIATLKALKALLSKNYLRVVAYKPSLRVAFFHNIREFLTIAPLLNSYYF
jgi:hypothetical protein